MKSWQSNNAFLLLLLIIGCILLTAFDTTMLSLHGRGTSSCRQRVAHSSSSSAASGTLLRFSSKSQENEERNNPENDTTGKTETARSYVWNRRNLLVAASITTSLSSSFVLNSAAAVGDESKKEVYQTITLPSGLKYIELREGTGPTPRYGQLLSIGYTGYVKIATKQSTGNNNESPPIFEKVDAYLVKHGNGRLIPGLEEGLHTMKVGGLRRIIIPPKLGYVDIGLGPIPESPVSRYKLNRLLEKMVASKNGQVIFDIYLRKAFDDEADQGYYNDRSLTPDEFNTLRGNIEQAQRDAKTSGITSGVVGNEA